MCTRTQVEFEEFLKWHFSDKMETAVMSLEDKASLERAKASAALDKSRNVNTQMAGVLEHARAVFLKYALPPSVIHLTWMPLAYTWGTQVEYDELCTRTQVRPG